MASDLTPEEIASLRAEALSGSGRQRRPRKDLWLKLLDMAERCADYDRRLSEVMPKDFKDWWQNSRREWPEVAAWTITNLRERLEEADAGHERAVETWRLEATSYVREGLYVLHDKDIDEALRLMRARPVADKAAGELLRAAKAAVQSWPSGADEINALRDAVEAAERAGVR